MLTLPQFLDKWSDAETRTQLMALLAAWFEDDPRTLRRWIANNQTPRKAALLLTFVDKQWQNEGHKNTALFFDL